MGTTFNKSLPARRGINGKHRAQDKRDKYQRYYRSLTRKTTASPLPHRGFKKIDDLQQNH